MTRETIREVTPGRLLCVDDVVPAGWKKWQPGQVNEIRGVFVNVTKNVAPPGGSP